MELVISLIATVTALIGTVWGIIKYYDVKRVKERKESYAREEKLQKEKQEKEQALNNTLQCISKSLEEINEKNQHQYDELKVVQNDLSSVGEQIKEIKAQQQEDEMDRLRSDIIDCVNKLQNGLIMSQADFLHIHHAYDKYTKNHGNSYIEGCMEFVTQYEEECRKNGIGVSFDSEEP